MKYRKWYLFSPTKRIVCSGNSQAAALAAEQNRARFPRTG
jgi:hypothetical protein